MSAAIALFKMMTQPEKLRALRDAVEEMAEGVALSDRAYNMFRTPHVVFANGAIKPEGEIAAQAATVDDAILSTLEAIESYKETIGSRVWLTWRAYPELADDLTDRPVVRCRLSFDRVRE